MTFKEIADRRKQAFRNASDPDIVVKKKLAKLLRDFVLNEEYAALIWRSVRVAHAAVGFTPDDFRESVENRAGVKPGNWIDHSSFKMNKDPYRQMEIQSWIKYLYYGGSRKRRIRVDDTTWKVVKDANGDDLYAEDQDYVLRYFGIKPEYDFSPVGDRQLKCVVTDYSWYMNPVLKLRNELGGHSNIVRVEELTLERLMFYYDGLMGALKPLVKTRWVAQEECQELVQTLETLFYSALGKVSYRVEDIMAQQDMDPSMQAEVEKLLAVAGMPVANGCVEIRGDIRDFSELLAEAWRYYELSEASGAEQLRAGMYDYIEHVAPEAPEEYAPEVKSVVALKNGVAADWAELADRYRAGVNGVEQDADMAIVWYEKAANAEVPELRAMYELGQIYERKDPIVALDWYRKAANLGYAKAQVQLGHHCWNGTRKQKRNWKESAMWYAMASEQGDAEGLCGFGKCYEYGRGVSKDPLQAVSYYSRAAEKGNKDARVYLASMQMRGVGMPKDTEKALASLQALGKEKNESAWVELGWCYRFGVGVTVDQKKSVWYFNHAANAGSARAMYYMGLCYEKGTGVSKDPGMARQWYMRAARKGHITSQLKCADKAALGRRWMKELVDENLAEAQLKMAMWALEEDPVQAVGFLKAAKEGSITAKRMLAECYVKGLGVSVDHHQARMLAEQVVEKASGKDLMLAEGILAQVYQETLASDPSQWTYWADRAAKNGHVRWALELAKYYNQVRWVGGELIFLEGADISKCMNYLEMAASSKYASSSIAWAFKDFLQTNRAYVPWQKCTDGKYYYFYAKPGVAYNWYRRAMLRGSHSRFFERTPEHWEKIQKYREEREKKVFPYSGNTWRFWSNL
ncbi:MAG: sel1 repeat family protein [Lachnospiraceae bacterium]|nr:sel1 repeat family protein [Lachnospiraceae bacterium]